MTLLIVLAISLLLELGLTFKTFTDSTWLMSALGSSGGETELVNHVMGWFLLLVSMLIILCIYGVWKKHRETNWLIGVLSVWWIGIGVAIYVVGGRTGNLLTDSLKGAVLLALVAFDSRRASALRLE